MLSSKDILERTGISRATLNNYISYGLVPRPQVLPPEPGDAGAPRLGYFPDDTVERVETIQRLKREGWSLGRILDHFGAAAPEMEGEADPRGADEEPEPSIFPPMAAPGAAQPAAAPAPRMAPVSAAAAQIAHEGVSVHAVPQTLPVAVLSVALADADDLWTCLLVQEYFELANEFCASVQALARLNGGRVQRTSPHRLVCHFLPQAGRSQFMDALRTAQALQGAIQAMSQRWQIRKGWTREIGLRCGAAEGEAWVGHGGGPGEDLQVVGDVGNQALLLSRAARGGAALVTRDLVARLAATDRAQAVYGVPDSPAADAPLRLMVFTRLREFAPHVSPPRRLGDLPVAELVSLGLQRTGPAGSAGAPNQGTSA
ncbi:MULTISPECIES: hypothetical protein [Ramlibacter]|uniref:MerR family transcriptional regulator n=1 Tax=Ramlibacter aquaticus TaxID=2780094 RepID=A0ABR9SFU4_9BURK|nr:MULTISPECIES: hypothetical protein [Ramlibacter]MBE7941213.1 hypothetical protein [Ramlibacter aquaticus]